MGKYIKNEDGTYERYAPLFEGAYPTFDPDTGKYIEEPPMTLEQMKEVLSAVEKEEDSVAVCYRNLSGQTIPGTEERVVNTLEADINHDGVADRIVTSITVKEGRENLTPEELVEAGEICYVRAFDGKSEEKLLERNYYDGFFGNGQLMLVEADKNAYLMECKVLNQKEQYYIFYEMAWIPGNTPKSYYNREDSMICPDEIRFHVSSQYPADSLYERREYFPVFQENLEEWFDGAVLVAAVDSAEGRGNYISTEEKRYTPEKYFDKLFSDINIIAN